MNEKQIIVSCRYGVYDDEWQEISEQIRFVLKYYKRGKFSNVDIEIQDKS